MMTMKTHRSFALLGVFLLPSAAFALGPSEVFEKVAPSVWIVRGLDAQERPFTSGTGVVVEAGHIVTSCSVLAKAKAVQVRRGGRSQDATLEHADLERDLCLLRVEDLPASAVRLAPRAELKVGQRVYAVANTDKVGITLSEGMIAGLQSEDPALPPIQATTPLSHGASGGGLFDEQGRLVGITTLNVPRAGVAPNIHFASPAAWTTEIAERGRLALAKRAAPATTVSNSTGPESWTYRLTGRGLRAGSQEVTLVSASPGEIVEQVSGDDRNPRRAAYPKGAYVTQVGALSLFSPYLATFETLTPGKRLSVENFDARTCGPGWTCSIKGRVTGKERVKTPAGEFEAIRVQIEQFWVGLSQTNDRGETGGRTLDVWYVPTLKRAVKFSSRGEPSRYIDTAFDLELVSHTVKSP